MRKGFTAALLVIASVVPVACSFEYTQRRSAGWEVDDRARAAFDDVVRTSTEAHKKLLSRYQASSDQHIVNLAKDHFARAQEIVDRHFSRARKDYDSSDGRRRILERAGVLPLELSVVSSPAAFATAFPSGHIVVSDSLVMALLEGDDELSAALLGVLIHELIHVRDAHAAEQWMTADGRKSYLADQAKGVFGTLVSVIPGISVKYELGQTSAFRLSESLPGLSEYAADLGTITMLQAEGFNSAPYISFLRAAVSSIKQREGVFARLQGRTACLNQFSTGGNSNVTRLIIGDPDGTDPDPAFSIEISELQSERQLSNDKKKSADARLLLYMLCAVENTLNRGVRANDSQLQVPFFDTRIFTQYMALEPKKADHDIRSKV